MRLSLKSVSLLFSFLLLTVFSAHAFAENLITPPETEGEPVAVATIPGDAEGRGESVIQLFENRDGTKIRVLKVNGFIYRVEVTPPKGPTYLLIDGDGDGRFERQLSGYDQRLAIPHWVLFRF
ncbi:DUF2782 domain-containing protein [Magnetococcales bacterium HHB-1]